MTAEGAKRRYYRNHQVEGLWGDADAHVIWTFVYLSAEDESRFNHVCRSQWVHQSLAENARPSQMAGEHIGNDIVVDWNEHRLDLTQVRSANTLTKEAYLNRVSPLMGELKQLIEKLGCELLSLKNGDTTEETFLHSTEHDRQRINAIYTDVSSMSFAPFECIEMDKCLERLVASMDNVVLHYSETSRSRWTALDRIELALQQHSNATTDLGGLEYEFRKIR